MYDNTNKGVLFTNDQKGNIKAPVYKGKINVEGKEYELAGWVKEGKSGKFLSLTVSEPYNKEANNQKANDHVATFTEDDSSLPF